MGISRCNINKEVSKTRVTYHKCECLETICRNEYNMLKVIILF